MTPAEQPAPVATDARPTWELVIEDLKARTVSPAAIRELVIADATTRDSIGRSRYGCPLTPGNGRDSLRDAYEEFMDGAVYIKNAMIEAGGLRAYFEEEVLRCQYGAALSMCIQLRAAIFRRDGR